MQHWCNGSISAFQAGGTGSSPVCCSNNSIGKEERKMVSIMFETKQKVLNYLRKHNIDFWHIVYIAESSDGCELVYRR